jgi:acetyl/propionyl-CoA carboxylase alpha subunit
VGPDGDFYFIEMNTRLQVEHPVTEAITGVDLIGWQLEIAAGAPLTLEQTDLKIDGAAIECRLYAEDPERRFLPRPGHIERFEPPTGDGIRVDSGVGPGQEVTPYYDPMLAKLVAHGPDRETATARARRALEAWVVEPLTTNRLFLHQVLGEDAFVTAQFDTGWLERYVKGKA